jgi:hypothetical protein
MILQRARAFKAIDRYAKLVQNLTIIFGIFAGVISLFATQFDRRVARTIDMTKFYADRVRGDYLALSEQWDAATQSNDRFFQQSPDEMKRLVLDFFHNRDAHSRLINYLDFFDGLIVCIDNRACDRNSAIDYFSTSARFVYEMSAFYIADTRANDRDPTFGAGLERFNQLAREHLISRYL